MIPNRWFVAISILLLALVGRSANAAQAATSYTVQLPASVPVSKLQRAFPQVKMRPLFSQIERRNLLRFHRKALAETLFLGPLPGNQASAFVEQFNLRFPKLKLEKNGSVEFRAMDPQNSDPLYSQQWFLKNTGQEVRIDLDDLRTEALRVVPGEDLQLPEASELANLKPVVVAVLDTGLDITHPDLKPILRSKKDECEALTTYLDCLTAAAAATPAIATADAETKCLAKVGNIDRDGNGYPLDCVGWSVISSLSTNEASPLNQVLGTPDMDDVLGHGTHVAGIIAGAQNNGIGIKGIASNVKILPIRVIDTPPIAPLRPQSLETNSGAIANGANPVPSPNESSLKIGKSSVELIARGLLYAITEHVQVINLSLGWPSTINSSVINDMIKLAQEQGIAVVAAAGNDSTDALVLPCSISGVICVGSYGPDGKRAPYSNRGPGVDLLAPGTSILSTYPSALRAHFFTDLQGYEIMSGTSMSAPMVSGALALMLGKGLSLDESLARLIAGARVEGAAVGENLRLDLAKSLKLSPRPLVRVLERAPVRLIWHEPREILQGSFHVKNLWKEAVNCSISYELQPLVDSVDQASLNANVVTSTGTSNCGAFKTGEEKNFPFSVQVRGFRANRDFILNAKISYSAPAGAIYQQTLQVGVQVVPTQELVSKTLSYDNTLIEGSQIGEGTLVRTLVAKDSKSTDAKPEYIVLSRAGDDIAIQVLTARKSKAYQYSAAQKITDLSWNLLVGQRFYSEEAKATRVALLFWKRGPLVTDLTQIRFDVFDENLENKVRSFVYDGTLAALPENFRWTSLNGKDAVLFVANGKEPASSDVWHPVPEEMIVLRCFLLNSEGVLSQVKVDANDPETRIVDLLPYRSEDTDRNESSLLVIRGRDYRLIYFIGHLKDGKVVSLKPFEINPYRNMGFLSPSPLLSESGPASGSVLSSSVGRGHLRATVLLRSAYDTITNSDFRFAPLNSENAVNRIVGGYMLAGKNAFFTQTNWDLQFHEFSTTGETVVKTSMNRFSFIPSLVSQRAFFPILVNNEQGVPEPAVLTEDAGSGFFNLSTLMPNRDASGKVVGIARPALLSFESNEKGCSFIGNPVWDDFKKVFRMNSFCGGSIQSVLLKLPR